MQVRRLEIGVYRIPTDMVEADGTFRWDATTMVLVEAYADAGVRGLGFTYGAPAAANLIRDFLEPVVVGGSVEDVGHAWTAMVAAVRNIGHPGVAATAISAVDIALWDLHTRVMGQPLFRVLGRQRDRVPIYGSGGFTSYSKEELVAQLGGWLDNLEVRQSLDRLLLAVYLA